MSTRPSPSDAISSKAAGERSISPFTQPGHYIKTRISHLVMSWILFQVMLTVSVMVTVTEPLGPI